MSSRNTAYHGLTGRKAEGVITEGYFVKVGSADSAKALVANTDDLALGVIKNTVAIGDTCVIYGPGSICPVKMASSVSAGQRIMIDANGKGTVCTGDGDVSWGQAQFDAASGAPATVLLTGPLYIVTLADLH